MLREWHQGGVNLGCMWKELRQKEPTMTSVQNPMVSHMVAAIIQSWIKGDFSGYSLMLGINPSIIRRPELGMLGEELVQVGEGLAERLNMKEV
jgi:hypothetical protein